MVIALRKIECIAGEQLPHFTHTHFVGCPSQDLNQIEPPETSQFCYRSAVEEIAHDHSRLVIPERIDGGHAAPQYGMIDCVVVHECCQVHQFDQCCQSYGPSRGFATDLVGKQQQRGPKQLSPRPEEVIVHLLDRGEI